MNVWLLAAMSVDGKIAQAQNQSSMEWTSKEDTRFFIEKTKEAGVVIMGSKTFETIGRPLSGRRLIVMTHELPPVNGTIEYTNLGPHELLENLDHEGVETVVVAGGSSVYSQFLREGLVTDLFLTIEPYLFGSGLPLASGFDQINLHLVQVTRLGEQAILLHYSHVF